jgi:DNA repair protein RadC
VIVSRPAPAVHSPITDWPKNEQPREKLRINGAEALSDAELLAIFLRVGVKGKSAVAAAGDGSAASATWIVVASLSPQSVASISNQLGLGLDEQ